MGISVNKVGMELDRTMSVTELLQYLHDISFDVRTLEDVFMFLLNGEFIEEKDYDTVYIRENDRIDLFPLTTGG